MPDNTPSRVPFPVDELTAAEGRDTISLAKALKPKDDAVAAAFREHFGIAATNNVDQTARDAAAAEATARAAAVTAEAGSRYDNDQEIRSEIAYLPRVVTAQRSIGKFIAGSPATPASQTNTIGAGTPYADHAVWTLTINGAPFNFEANFDGAGSPGGNVAFVPSSLGPPDIAAALAATIVGTLPSVVGANWSDPNFTVQTVGVGAAATMTLTDPLGGGAFTMSAQGADPGADTGATYRKLLEAPGAGKQWRILGLPRCNVPGSFYNQWTTAALMLVAKLGDILYPIARIDAHSLSLYPDYGARNMDRHPMREYDLGLENAEIGIATVDPTDLTEPSPHAILLAEPVGSDLQVIVDAVPTQFPNTECY